MPKRVSLRNNLRKVYNFLRSANSPYLREFPAGHFYSPLPNPNEISTHRSIIFNKDDDCRGISLNDEFQLQILSRMESHYSALPFVPLPTSNRRYYYDNPFFSYGDAIILFGLLNLFRPNRIIEIGSGFSSAAMLDCNSIHFQGNMHLTFIEPYPHRLYDLIEPGDIQTAEIVESRVQDVSPDKFRLLKQNDILFIDSSHVAKVGSDVLHILFRIIPIIEPGVIIHFHDVHWPFEYPAEVIQSGYAWNEAYLLRAFLQYNDAFEIIYFNSFIAEKHRAQLEKSLPLCLKNPGGGLWLRKIGDPLPET